MKAVQIVNDPTLLLLLDEPCQADEIWTRMFESRVRGIDGEAGTDLGLCEKFFFFHLETPVFFVAQVYIRLD